MFEAVFPNLALLFAPRERAMEALPPISIRYRKKMIRQTLHEYGHWLDQDTLARMLEELEGGPRQSG
jgi:hypothetical protein